jgi:antitoxin component YwqK of YwqJK toxin-antitoxin module
MVFHNYNFCYNNSICCFTNIFNNLIRSSFLFCLILIKSHFILSQKQLWFDDYNSFYQNPFTQYETSKSIIYSNKGITIPKYKGIETSIVNNDLRVVSVVSNAVLVESFQRKEELLGYEYEVLLEVPYTESSVYFSFNYTNNEYDKFLLQYNQNEGELYFSIFKNGKFESKKPLILPNDFPVPKYPRLTVRAIQEDGIDYINVFVNGFWVYVLKLNEKSKWKSFQYGYHLVPNKEIKIREEKSGFVQFSLDNLGNQNTSEFLFDGMNETSFRLVNNTPFVNEKDNNRVHFLFFAPLESLPDLEDLLKQMLPKWQLGLDPIIKIYVTNAVNSSQFNTNISLLTNTKKINVIKDKIHFLPRVDYSEPWCMDERFESLNFVFYIPEIQGYYHLMEVTNDIDCQVLDPFTNIVQNFKDNNYFLDKDWNLTCEKNASFKREIIQKGNLFLMKDYYWPSGKTQMIGQYASLYPVNREGQSVWYSEGGKITQKANFKNNKRNGVYEKYSKEGILTWRENYVNGTVHGYTESYFHNGKLYRKAKYVNGEIDSIEVHYHDNGKVFARTLHNNGKIVSRIEVFDYYGRKQPFGNLKDGTGDLIIYNAYGFVPLRQEGYLNGILVQSKLLFADRSVLASIGSLNETDPKFNELEFNLDDFIAKFKDAINAKSLGPLKEFVFLPTIQENLNDDLRNKKYLSQFIVEQYSKNSKYQDSLINAMKTWEKEKFKTFPVTNLTTYHNSINNELITHLSNVVNKYQPGQFKFRNFKHNIIFMSDFTNLQERKITVTLNYESTLKKTENSIRIGLLATPFGWVIHSVNAD